MITKFIYSRVSFIKHICNCGVIIYFGDCARVINLCNIAIIRNRANLPATFISNPASNGAIISKIIYHTAILVNNISGDLPSSIVIKVFYFPRIAKGIINAPTIIKCLYRAILLIIQIINRSIISKVLYSSIGSIGKVSYISLICPISNRSCIGDCLNLGVGLVIKIIHCPSVIKILYPPLGAISEIIDCPILCVSDSSHFSAIIIKVCECATIGKILYYPCCIVIKICDCPLIIPASNRACIIDRIYCSCRGCVIKAFNVTAVINICNARGIIHISNAALVIDTR